MKLADLTPGGASTYSKCRHPANAPELALSCSGAYLIGSDGNDYIDYTSALGAVILGHRHPETDGAIMRQLLHGISASLPTLIEQELAVELVRLIPGAEMVRFAKNGNDVTNAAVRIARAHTGREYIVAVKGYYHGHADWCMGLPPMNGGVIGASRARTFTFDRFDLGMLEAILGSQEAACVILEPVLSSDPVIPPPKYFRSLRELCDRYGTLLIFDELVTGWRAGLPGYPTGVIPDLSCYGKAIANGMPLAVLAGPRRLMRRIEKDVFFSTTFGGECLSLAAALATIKVLERDNAATILAERGEALRHNYGLLAASLDLDTELYGYPQRLVMRWADPDQKRVFLETLVSEHILTQGYFNLTLAHDDDIIALTIRSIERAMLAVKLGARVAA